MIKITPQEKAEHTITSVEAIESVKVSPFLKDSILNRLETQTTQMTSSWVWFSPKLQLAVLIVFMILNIYTYINLSSVENNSDEVEFAISSGLVDDYNHSVFN